MAAIVKTGESEFAAQAESAVRVVDTVLAGVVERVETDGMGGSAPTTVDISPPCGPGNLMFTRLQIALGGGTR